MPCSGESPSIFPTLQGTKASKGFFSWRVWKVTQSRVLGAVCLSLALVRLAFSTTGASVALTTGTFEGIITKFRWGVVFTLAVCAAADMTIATILCITLLRVRSPFKA